MSNPLNPVIERLERNAKILREFGDLLDRDPSLVPLLREALGVDRNGQTDKQSNGQEPKGKPAGKTLFARTAAFFEANGNQWATTTELRTALGVSRGAIGSVLYQTHVDRFANRDHPNSGKLKQFRLKGGDAQ